MNTVVRAPTPELVKAACKAFDLEYAIVERALENLFSQYPSNSDHSHVLLKVVALNRLYTTQIFAVHDVARHIHEQAEEIDAALAAGSPEIVHKIATVTISTSGKVRDNYSFATKYCSWHNQAAYPIWDSRVHKYLWALQKQDPKCLPRFQNSDLWNYSKFLRLMSTFRDSFRLGEFSFKEIDKFLWSENVAREVTLASRIASTS